MHIHTHYDNLQLSQTATDAEIRQAYRRLSKKYHPDLCDDPDAHRIMQIVNRAYEVLSNPETRAEHDKWIAMQYWQRQQVQVVQPQSITYYSTEEDDEPNYPSVNQHHNNNHHYKRILGWLLAVAVVMLGLIVWKGWGVWERNPWLAMWFNDTPAPMQNTVNLPAHHGNTALAQEDYVRPETAPNGSPFPETSDYIAGYPVIAGMGTGKLVIENVRNSSDVFAQLYEKNSPQPIRTFFIVEREEMTLTQLDAGEYFVRYYQLDNGEYLDSESVTLVRNQSATIYLQRGKAPTYH